MTDKRCTLFNLEKPLEIPTEEFHAEWWPLVDSFWTRIQHNYLITPDVIKCIRRYSKNTKQWALWARQHSPLLLQVTTTNPLESYLSELKRASSKTHALFGTPGTVYYAVPADFRTKRISIIDLSETILEQVHKFPFPVQELIIGKARAMSARIEKGKTPPELIAPECNCHFFSRYLLPCRHILHAHLFGTDPPEKLVTIEDWMNFQHMFDEAGMEVYQSRKLVEVPVYIETEEERRQTMYWLKANALLENVRNGFWKAMERGDDNDIQGFIDDLAHFAVSHSE
ncbi:hypothetical protein KI688_006595 [Linnemannia hyalina]|uniref:SWIM-type domain-containing protein n=1 Tax=Linnemannia hyalina TaxID=64524 RepID=A0A9P7XLF1_9FUNG|nr:hypothetical protein KI688_006595 [Linnemannia hyalina]